MKLRRKKKTTLLRRVSTFDPGIAALILGIAILVGGIYMGAADATNNTTTTTCKAKAVKDIDDAKPASNQVVYSFDTDHEDSEDGKRTALATVKAGSSCVGFKVSMVTYKTPKDGKPITKQTIFDGQTKMTSKHGSSFSVDIPDCYYQIDLVYGNPKDLRTDSSYDDDHLALSEVRGGDDECSGSDDENDSSSKPEPSPTPKHTPKPTGTGSGTSTGSGTGAGSGSGSGSGSGPGTNTTGGSNSASGSGTNASNQNVTLAQGEKIVTQPQVAGINSLLPQTGKTGQVVTIIGALFITFGLLHVWLTQRHKILVPNRRS